MRYRIGRFDELSDPGSRGFILTLEKNSVNETNTALEGFIVRVGDRLSAYLNRCPHTGVNLNWMPDVFLSADKQFIQCSMHGALFQPEDGLCIHGPCLGHHLQPLKVQVENEIIWVLYE